MPSVQFLIDKIRRELNRIESRTMKRFEDSVNKCDVSAIAESSGDLVYDITTTESLLLNLGKLEKVSSVETIDFIERLSDLSEKHHVITSNLENKCRCTPI